MNQQLLLTFMFRILHLIFHPFEVVSRYQDIQLQVGENYIFY